VAGKEPLAEQEWPGCLAENKDEILSSITDWSEHGKF
jgi:hypothetical protein